MRLLDDDDFFEREMANLDKPSKFQTGDFLEEMEKVDDEDVRFFDYNTLNNCIPFIFSTF